nr:GyrI-like domain-containing protein [Bacillus sp. FJAT-42315]
MPNKNESSNQMMNYWIATAHIGETPEGLQTLEIPASKWGIFEVHGPMPDAMQKTWQMITSEWFPSHQYEYAGTPELEVYTDEDPSSPDLYSEIWIPLK